MSQKKLLPTTTAGSQPATGESAAPLTVGKELKLAGLALPKDAAEIFDPDNERKEQGLAVIPGVSAGRRTRESDAQLLADPELLDYRIRETICQMVMWGVPEDDIALLMRLDVTELTKRYGHELTTGKRQMEVNLGGRLYDIGMGSPDHSASIRAINVLLANKAGWRTPGKGGTNINTGGGDVKVNQIQFVLPERASPEDWGRMVKAAAAEPVDPESVVLTIPHGKT